MVFDGSGGFRRVVFCEELDDCWQTEDIWGVVMAESLNLGVTGITGDDKSFIFELLSFLLKHRLSQGVFCEDLDDCWPTEDIWGVFMT